MRLMPCTHRKIAPVAILLSLLVTGVSPALSQPAPEITDAAVTRAIERGVEYLWSTQGGDGGWPPHGKKGANHYYEIGPSCLACLALLESGVSPQDPRMAKALEFISTRDSDMTYELGIRANVYLAAFRHDPAKWRPFLQKDVAQLMTSTRDGSYNYVSAGDGQSRGDNSNSQYGLLGVWAGAQGGVAAEIEIPGPYWYKVMKHWADCQNADGGWPYRKGQHTKATMTAAGVASLFVCFDNIFYEAFVECDTGLELPPIRRGLEWFERNYEATGGGGYYLYGVERVGLASGYKYFGTVDWYKVGAERILRSQNASGGWGGGRSDSPVQTSFYLLFLIRGQHPVLVNKLEFDADWNNRPRDLAMLTRWVDRTFETRVNWQIINLRVPVREWHDAPILYVSASRTPEFSDEDLDKLRDFVWQGGTIFSATECDGPQFRKAIREVYEKLFPEYSLEPLPPEHDIYALHFKTQARVPLFMISNGVRPLVIHTDQDIPLDWQMQKYGNSFETAANVFMYITDLFTLRNRGTTLWPKEPDSVPSKMIRLAVLKHGGNWQPEKLAHERLRRKMARDARVHLKLFEGLEVSELGAQEAKIATVTGTGELDYSSAQRETLKQWIENGGTLIVDAAGGSKEFAASARDMLREMFGPYAMQPLSATADALRVPDRQGMAIEEVRYRRRTRGLIGPTKDPRLRVVMVENRPAVFYSGEDLTGGLVGYPAYSVNGYEPESAYELMRNMILSAGPVEDTPREEMHAGEEAATEELDADASPSEDMDPAEVDGV
jgi:hypothetical protein